MRRVGLHRSRRGATLLDMLVLVGCLVILANIALRVPDVIDYQFRRTCFQNQEQLDAQLYSILEAERAEVYHVAGAFVYRSNRSHVPPRMIVLLTPDVTGKWNRVISRETSGSFLPRNLSCPVDSHADVSLGVIDYAYLHGAWRCVYEPTHN